MSFEAIFPAEAEQRHLLEVVSWLGGSDAPCHAMVVSPRQHRRRRRSAERRAAAHPAAGRRGRQR
jgi:hypothetical protein